MANEEIERWLRENLPSGTGARQVDVEAIMAWVERNPDATPEEVRQVLMAPDHNLGDITAGSGPEEAS